MVFRSTILMDEVGVGENNWKLYVHGKRGSAAERNGEVKLKPAEPIYLSIYLLADCRLHVDSIKIEPYFSSSKLQ